EPRGLLALMVLTEARRPARFSPSGDIVLLADQDRDLWDKGLLASGVELARDALMATQPGPYTVQAAIAAVPAAAPSVEATDWRRIVDLYDALFTLQPTAIVELNRAIAIAEVHGPERAFQIVDKLPLERYHLWHATRGNLLDRMGRNADARAAYATALE